MDCSCCGFERIHSRPANITKGGKKTAFYPEMRHSQQSLVRCLASPLFLPDASSYYKVQAVAQQAKANAARIEAETARSGEG
jgi:hypothetical protein